jgi:hypothetical protein
MGTAGPRGVKMILRNMERYTAFQRSEIVLASLGSSSGNGVAPVPQR